MNWWHYLLLVNIYLTLFFGFYALLLRSETFFQLNRIYLVGAALLSFFIPMIQSDWIRDLFITQKVQYTIYGTGPEVNITALAPIKDSPYTLGQIFVMLYILGVAILALRLMWQFVLLRRVIKQASPKSAPYSFFNKISVNEDTGDRDVIMAHEQVHAKQWHSADVLVIEAVMIINWFNPVVYLYRYSIKHIHEFIADRQAIKAGNDKAEYALLLLSQTFNAPAHQLVNPFYNHSLLKKRIMMLQKNKSARIKLLKYGLSAPMFILMLVLSSATISNSKAVESINNNAERLFSKSAIFKTPSEEEAIKNYKLKLVDADVRKALSVDTSKKKNQVYTAVEKQPAFPGGDKAFGVYLGKTVRYPKVARENNVQGRVILTFVVEKNGSISDIKVVRGVGSGLDEEAVRAMKLSPKWKPGMQKGKKVRVQYAVPISFTLTADDEAENVKQTPQNNTEVFTAVEQAPAFPGGNEGFAKYLQKTIRYPAEACTNKIQGRVIASFVVERDGSISGAKIVHGIGYGADEEALRVVKAMPNWNPGMQNGKPVRVIYTVPIAFTLDGKQLNLQGKVDPRTNYPKTYTLAPGDTGSYKAANGETFIQLRGAVKPLYILDGKEVFEINDIDPKSIESISVIKNADAILKYGDKGKNGVVIVKRKITK